MSTAVCKVVERLGFSAPKPVILQSSNHLVLRLDPHPIVAKAALRADGLSVDGFVDAIARLDADHRLDLDIEARQ